MLVAYYIAGPHFLLFQEMSNRPVKSFYGERHQSYVPPSFAKERPTWKVSV